MAPKHRNRALCDLIPLPIFECRFGLVPMAGVWSVVPATLPGM